MKIVKKDAELNNNFRNYKNDFIVYCVRAIDAKNTNKIKYLINTINKKKSIIHNNKVDIILEIYNNNSLTTERLQFIIESCNDFLKVSSDLTKKLIKDDNIILLDVIFKQFKFFDNEFIIGLLLNYRNKTPIDLNILSQQFEKYKLSVNINNRNFIRLKPKCHKYLISACESGNVEIVKYLVRHGADIYKENRFGRTVLFDSCINGYEKILKYLIRRGADINKE
ncbi:hypothetical protein H8356DRAFT_1032313, partial [Neocallimastix lanati (nom. inval.)]